MRPSSCLAPHLHHAAKISLVFSPYYLPPAGVKKSPKHFFARQFFKQFSNSAYVSRKRQLSF